MSWKLENPALEFMDVGPLMLSMAMLLTSWLALFTWSLGSDRTTLLLLLMDGEVMCWKELVGKNVGEWWWWW